MTSINSGGNVRLKTIELLFLKLAGMFLKENYMNGKAGKKFPLKKYQEGWRKNIDTGKCEKKGTEQKHHIANLI